MLKGPRNAPPRGTAFNRELDSFAKRKAVPSRTDRLAEDIELSQLWLHDGAPVPDVITVLEAHHRFKVSRADCRALAVNALWAAQAFARAIPTSIQIQRSPHMPLLEIAQTRHFVSAMIRIEDGTALRIDQYAAFMKTTADEVVDKALAYVFAKDKDFQEFLESPQSKRVPRSLRVRTAGQNGSSTEPTNGAAKSAKAIEATHDPHTRS